MVGNLHLQTGFECRGLEDIVDRVALESWLRLGDQEHHCGRKIHRHRFPLVKGDDHLLVMLHIGHQVANEISVQLILLEIFRIHEHEELTIGVQVLAILLVQVCGFYLVC